MSKIEAISKHLDKLLDIPRWSSKEIAYYNMLKEKVEKFSYKLQVIELDNDKKLIKANIGEQDWFKDSQHSTTINGYLDEMEIEEYGYKEQPATATTGTMIETNLIVRFAKSKFKLFVYFLVDPDKKVTIKGCTLPVKTTEQSLTKFYAYVEDFNKINRSYIAYYDNEDVMGINQTIKLPDLGQILQIVKVGAPTSKLDLLRMFVEIILFYDESGKINKCFIGVNHPLSISHFLRDFSST
jgi:hypothetical protein